MRFPGISPQIPTNFEPTRIGNFIHNVVKPIRFSTPWLVDLARNCKREQQEEGAGIGTPFTQVVFYTPADLKADSLDTGS